MRRAGLAAILAVVLVGGELRSAPPRAIPDVGAGRVAWFDITSTDVARSREFYGKLFDWQFEPVQGSTQALEIVAGGTPIGTLRGADGTISLFNGVVYIQVNDLPAMCKKAAELGGKLAPGFPFNLPDGRGAIGLLADPSGHPIGMYSRMKLPAPPVK
ncbi:MAG TPA: VOC family protein [Thermoanaerobaculia bacterium]|nr:VOC family protein [Thermoanaerobaculia bacterium]